MKPIQPVILRTSRLKYAGFALLSLAFVMAGFWMLREGNTSGWLGISFFGLGSVVFLVQLLPRASYLALDSEGFTMCSLFRAHTIRWEDVSDFGVGQVFAKRMVMFNFVDAYSRSSRMRSLNTSLAGYQAALPDTYGLKHDDLVDLLRRYKRASEGA